MYIAIHIILYIVYYFNYIIFSWTQIVNMQKEKKWNHKRQEQEDPAHLSIPHFLSQTTPQILIILNTKLSFGQKRVTKICL